jgi:hypothetical protein
LLSAEDSNETKPEEWKVEQEQVVRPVAPNIARVYSPLDPEPTNIELKIPKPLLLEVIRSLSVYPMENQAEPFLDYFEWCENWGVERVDALVR